MIELILNDILMVFRKYIPHAAISSIMVITVAFFIRRQIGNNTTNQLVRKYYKTLTVIFLTYIYCFCVVFITLLSREPGSRDSFDLRLFSTFSTDLKNNIYPIENIILFIPLGFLLPLLSDKFRKTACCATAAFFLSLSIETSQYITKRGYFQLDDIITNVLGGLLGLAFYHLLHTGYKAFINKKNISG